MFKKIINYLAGPSDEQAAKELELQNKIKDLKSKAAGLEYELMQARADLTARRKRHEEELSEQLQKIGKVCETLVKIKYYQENQDIYRVCVDFDSRAFHEYGSGPYEKEYVARYVADRIKNEILTSKFVQSARDELRRR